MSVIMNRNNNKDSDIKRDIETVSNFIQIYCEEKHRDREKNQYNAPDKIIKYLNVTALRLCDECTTLLGYSASKRIVCPYDPKPSCKNCETHCYRNGFRERIKEIMRFSGMHMIKRGRIGLIKKFFF